MEWHVPPAGYRLISAGPTDVQPPNLHPRGSSLGKDPQAGHWPMQGQKWTQRLAGPAGQKEPTCPGIHATPAIRVIIRVSADVEGQALS